MARTTGTVKWFSQEKGFGFLRQEDGPDVFVHHSAIRATGMRTLTEGERVEFDVVEEPKGLKAANVVRLDAPEGESSAPGGGYSTATERGGYRGASGREAGTGSSREGGYGGGGYRGGGGPRGGGGGGGRGKDGFDRGGPDRGGRDRPRERDRDRGRFERSRFDDDEGSDEF